MSAIVEALKQKSSFYCEKGTSEEDIIKAEQTLDLKFADEYKEYLLQYGAASCAGHELTGFSADAGLDVVRVTIQNRQRNPHVKSCLYVVEETHIDGIVIWQAGSGEVFQSEYKEAPRRKHASLTEYVATFDRDSPCTF